jgi:hypothetical protein
VFSDMVRAACTQRFNSGVKGLIMNWKLFEKIGCRGPIDIYREELGYFVSVGSRLRDL